MEIQPLCSVPGCGGLGLYRCSDCSRVFCAQHAVILSETSERGVAGLWLVHCHACRIQASNLASLGRCRSGMSHPGLAPRQSLPVEAPRLNENRTKILHTP
jgi:hypothetical protein